MMGYLWFEGAYLWEDEDRGEDPENVAAQEPEADAAPLTAEEIEAAKCQF